MVKINMYNIFLALYLECEYIFTCSEKRYNCLLFHVCVCVCIVWEEGKRNCNTEVFWNFHMLDCYQMFM